MSLPSALRILPRSSSLLHPTTVSWPCTVGCCHSGEFFARGHIRPLVLLFSSVLHIASADGYYDIALLHEDVTHEIDNFCPHRHCANTQQTDEH